MTVQRMGRNTPCPRKRQRALDVTTAEDQEVDLERRRTNRQKTKRKAPTPPAQGRVEVREDQEGLQDIERDVTSGDTEKRYDYYDIERQ